MSERPLYEPYHMVSIISNWTKICKVKVSKDIYDRTHFGVLSFVVKVHCSLIYVRSCFDRLIVRPFGTYSKCTVVTLLKCSVHYRSYMEYPYCISYFIGIMSF